MPVSEGHRIVPVSIDSIHPLQALTMSDHLHPFCAPACCPECQTGSLMKVVCRLTSICPSCLAHRFHLQWLHLFPKQGLPVSPVRSHQQAIQQHPTTSLPCISAPVSAASVLIVPYTNHISYSLLPPCCCPVPVGGAGGGCAASCTTTLPRLLPEYK